MLFVSHADDSFKPFEWVNDVMESVLVNFMAVNIGAAYLGKTKRERSFTLMPRQQSLHSKPRPTQPKMSKSDNRAKEAQYFNI